LINTDVRVVARGSSVLAKSVTPSRIDENRKLIQLNKEDMDKLEKVHQTKGITRYVYPAFGVDVGFADKPGGIDLSG
jgi:glycerol 2-dehydrogenase (NADP+)